MHLTSGDDERQNDTGKECSDFYLIDNENVKYFLKYLNLSILFHLSISITQAFSYS
jgi:hypothetical protein